MKVYNLDENWLIEDLPVWDWNNWRRYSNWIAIATIDEKGEEHREYLRPSKNEDEYFNLSTVKTGDILIAGCYDKRKSRGEHLYYAVFDKSADTIVMEAYTTYRKAKKGLTERKEVMEKTTETV